MSPRPLAALVVLASLAATGSAGAKPFVVSTSGNKPSVAVDLQGTTHIAWDSVSSDNTSTTHYCRVPRGAIRCAAGSERMFTPVTGDQDFGGPRLFLIGPKNVLVVTARCCTGDVGADQEFHESRTFAYSSADGGRTFGDPTWIGTQVPDVGAAFAKGAFLSLGIADDGTAIQSASLGGFAGAPRTITPKLANTGGVGTSPKGNVVAFADAQNNVFAGKLVGDPNGATVNFKSLGKGSDVVVTSGAKGTDVLFKTTGKTQRYLLRRYVGGTPRKTTSVSEGGFPIFGTAFQDAVGRVHTAWQGDLGLTYRVSDKAANHFGKMVKVTGRTGFFNLVIAANPKGKATIAYDTNGFRGRVGGFTAG